MKEYISGSISPTEIRSAEAYDGIEAVGISIQGKSHIAQKMVLQDNHSLCRLPNGWMMAAIADGVGSEPHADIGAKIAVETVTRFAQQYIGHFVDSESIIGLLRCCYQQAAANIEAYASEHSRPVHEYSTTLHTVIYANSRVLYGHAGDGGILAMLSDGTVRPVTSPQKAEDGQAVIPLMAGPEAWEFGVCDMVQSVMLCTDGVWDKLCSQTLQRNGYDCYRVLAGLFVSPWTDPACEGHVLTAENISNFLTNGQPNDFYPFIERMIDQGNGDNSSGQFVVDHLWENDLPRQMLQSIQDDMTVVVIQNTDLTPLQVDRNYFLPPDWKQLQQAINAEIYGHTWREL